MEQSSFFGQYLLAKGSIDAQQLVEATELQEKLNLKIWQLAEEKKLLTREQIREALSFQMRSGASFEEAVEKLGFLTRREIEVLVKEQKERHLYLGEILVKLGYLTEEGLKQSLEDFYKEQKRATVNMEKGFPERLKDVKPYIEKFSFFTTTSLQRMGNISAKYNRCEFIENVLHLAPISIQIKFDEMLNRCFSSYILMVNPQVAEIIATRIYKNFDLDNTQLSVESTLCEVVNLICGLAYREFFPYKKIGMDVPKQVTAFKGNETKYELNSSQRAAQVFLSIPWGSLSFFILFLGNSSTKG